MKNLIVMAFWATIITCTYGKNPPKSNVEVSAPKALLSTYQVDNPHKLLDKMLNSCDNWVVVDDAGVPVSYVSENRENIKMKTTFSDQKISIKINDLVFEVTGMRIDGNLPSANAITLWLKCKRMDSPEWQLKSDYNVGSEALQGAFDLALSYSILLR